MRKPKFTPSLLPNPFRTCTALYTVAERLAQKPQWEVRTLMHGLDILDTGRLLRYARGIYARRGQRLTMRGGRVMLR